jgi:Rps23 Pro-64 3,4-dihydroxylase Tpa1-like proline 4-hydroxylase
MRSEAPEAQHVPVVTVASELCVVIDNFLPMQLFEEVFRFCNSIDYSMVHTNKVRKVWRLHDGLPLHSETYHYKSDLEVGGGPRVYPTDTVLDRVIEAMLRSADAAAQAVGRPVADWQELTLGSWVYPVGSGLSLHQDTGKRGKQSYTGSYTFYVSPEWNLHWGGWLLVFDGREAAAAAGARSGLAVSPPWLGDELEQSLVRDYGLATAILPTPNRIVFISPRAPHMITRVDQNAGNHPRVSLAGFFLRTKPADR